MLDALVNNGMKEANEKSVSWEHVSEHTFSKFCEFAYTGTFSIPGPVAKGNGVEKALQDATSSERLTQFADLLIFSECYAVDALLAATASKLEQVLASLPPFIDEIKARAVADLFKYCYTMNCPVILQDILKAFMHQYAEVLWQYPYFKGIVKESEVLGHVLLDWFASRPQGVSFRCMKCGKFYPGMVAYCCGGTSFEFVYAAEGVVPKRI